MSLGEAGVMDCITDLEKKYADVYSSDSVDEVEAKIIKTMKKIKSCDLTYALVMAGKEMD
jgi:hypothetical protein